MGRLTLAGRAGIFKLGVFDCVRLMVVASVHALGRKDVGAQMILALLAVIGQGLSLRDRVSTSEWLVSRVHLTRSMSFVFGIADWMHHPLLD